MRRTLCSSYLQLADDGEWHNAAARVRQAAHILSYLGNHVLMLTSMVLRDYLALKVRRGSKGWISQERGVRYNCLAALFFPFTA